MAVLLISNRKFQVLGPLAPQKKQQQQQQQIHKFNCIALESIRIVSITNSFKMSVIYVEIPQ